MSNTTLQNRNCSSLINLGRMELYYNSTHYCGSCKLEDARLLMLRGCGCWRPQLCNIENTLNSHDVTPSIEQMKSGLIRSWTHGKLTMVSVIFAVLILCAVVGTIFRSMPRRSQNVGKRIKFSERSISIDVVHA